MLPFGSCGIPPNVVVRGTDFISIDNSLDPGSWLTPEIIRKSTALVFYDNDGNLRKQYGGILDENGYTVRVFDLPNPSQSNKYNPFAYIRNDKCIPKLVDALIAGTTGHAKDGDVEFVLAESLLFTALISYIHDEAPSYERNLNMLTTALQYMEIEKDNEGCRYKHALDFLFEDKEADDSYHLSVQKYNRFDAMTGDNPENIIASCIARLAAFDTDEMKALLSDDEIHLDDLCYPKTALFVTAGDYEKQQNVIIAFLYAQLFDILCDNNVVLTSDDTPDYERDYPDTDTED